MKNFLLLLSMLTSANVFSVDFRSFDDYKTNNALLSSDISRLESLNNEKSDLLYKDTLNQFKLLLVNYELINSRLSLKTFTTDAAENGWSRTANKARGLVDVCEGETLEQSKCFYELNQLKMFVAQSDLRNDNKESINGFIDNYIAESAQLAVFDEQFISSFNENTRLINERITAVKTVPAITVKITPAKKMAPLAMVVLEKKSWEYYYFSGSLLFFMGALIFYKRKKKINSLKSFYARIFQIARKNKMKVKFFGYIDFSALSVMGKIEKPFLESIQNLRSFAPEAHMKFKTQKNVLKIETLFFSNLSILGFVEKEAEVLKEKLEDLQQSVSACGGELIYINHFNTSGEIITSNLRITLPMN